MQAVARLLEALGERGDRATRLAGLLLCPVPGPLPGPLSGPLRGLLQPLAQPGGIFARRLGRVAWQAALARPAQHRQVVKLYPLAGREAALAGETAPACAGVRAPAAQEPPGACLQRRRGQPAGGPRPAPQGAPPALQQAHELEAPQGGRQLRMVEQVLAQGEGDHRQEDGPEQDPAQEVQPGQRGPGLLLRQRHGPGQGRRLGRRFGAAQQPADERQDQDERQGQDETYQAEEINHQRKQQPQKSQQPQRVARGQQEGDQRHQPQEDQAVEEPAPGQARRQLGALLQPADPQNGKLGQAQERQPEQKVEHDVEHAQAQARQGEPGGAQVRAQPGGQDQHHRAENQDQVRKPAAHLGAGKLRLRPAVRQQQALVVLQQVQLLGKNPRQCPDHEQDHQGDHVLLIEEKGEEILPPEGQVLEQLPEAARAVEQQPEAEQQHHPLGEAVAQPFGLREAQPPEAAVRVHGFQGRQKATEHDLGRGPGGGEEIEQLVDGDHRAGQHQRRDQGAEERGKAGVAAENLEQHGNFCPFTRATGPGPARSGSGPGESQRSWPGAGPPR